MALNASRALGLEKDDAIDKYDRAYQRQNAALTESSSKINMQLNAIEQLYKVTGCCEVVKDARDAPISMTDAIAKFNEFADK
ncbi:hypothetical protein FQA39_LY19433 [Lamprigera yunnana]|nr:hypothetical protein FQA39_LY19433 [Lamprigera yunnana]